MRYPSHLLPEVTALLQSAEQAATLAQSQLQAHGTLQKQQQQQEKVRAPAAWRSLTSFACFGALLARVAPIRARTSLASLCYTLRTGHEGFGNGSRLGCAV